jgi:hypothetical protein
MLSNIIITKTMATEITTKKKYVYPPEKIREYNKKMYDKNKEKERFECPICFGVYTYYNKSHHTHSDIHQRAIKYLEQQKEKKMNPPTLDLIVDTTENKNDSSEININENTTQK